VNIWFIASECVPFSKTGGLADVVGALPRVLTSRGHQVSVFLPLYRHTDPGRLLVPNLSVSFGHLSHVVDIREGKTIGGVRHFFVDYPPYYDRESLYVDGGADYPDNPERFALLCRAALEFLRHAGRPDLLHCHDWQTAQVPVLLKSVLAGDPFFQRLPVVFTVHNLGYQGIYGADALHRIGLPPELFSLHGLEFYGLLNLLKGGLVFSDFVTTVSRRYAQEIQTPEFGHGLDGVIRSRADTVLGILNGVDYDEWNPETDRFLPARYSASDLSGKQHCKRDVLERFHLPADSRRRPLIGIVSRFATQKGFDLIVEQAEAIVAEKVSLVALGSGEPALERQLRELSHRFPQRFAVRVAYDNALAHKIEGGSDIFLMPSRYEPCGLNQIYSLRYGTVPVVRATGGLDDTIEPFDPRTGQGTGFKFQAYTGASMLACLRRALDLYHLDPAAWQQLMRNGMACDFSWKASAAEYESLYERVVRRAQ